MKFSTELKVVLDLSGCFESVSRLYAFFDLLKDTGKGAAGATFFYWFAADKGLNLS